MEEKKTEQKEARDFLYTKQPLDIDAETGCYIYRERDILDAMDQFEAYLKQPKKEAKTIEERNVEFLEKVKEVLELNMHLADGLVLIDFVNYWTERSPNAKKMRFEKEKVFDIKKRLERWKRNNFGNNGKPTRTSTDSAVNSFISH